MARDFVVVGAGINGLCAAWQLARRVGGHRVAVLERGEEGHSEGSSHGEERITRSSYASRAWVERMQRAHAELWPALEADVGERLVVRGGDALFFGPEAGGIGAYCEAIRGLDGVDVLPVGDARRRFPAFTFAGCERVIHDGTAGVVAAGAAMRGLRRWLARHGVALHFGVTVTGIAQDGPTVRIRSTAGEQQAQQVAICAGPWLPRLLPGWVTRVAPARQDVGFWRMNVRAGTFPAWVHLGVGGLSYGLPTLAGGEMKAAFHRTAGVGGPVPAGFDDPAVAIEPRTQALDDVEADLHLWFSPGPGRRTRQERCFYTNAPADDFLIDRARDLAGVLVVSACSGHAFKLGPWTGTVVAERLLDGT